MRPQHENDPLRWRKSSYSGSGSGNCVEVAARWRKSSYSSGSSANCVEVAHQDAEFAVRDSKNPAGPVLRFDTTAWSAFLASLRQ